MLRRFFLPPTKSRTGLLCACLACGTGLAATPGALLDQGRWAEAAQQAESTAIT